MRALLAIAGFLAPLAALAQEASSAPAADAAAAPSPLMNFLPLVLIFGVFYFLLFRPQQRRFKQHEATLSSLKKGDEIVTGGGIIGKITKVGTDDVLHVELASGVEVKVLKTTVTSLYGVHASPFADKSKAKAGDKKNDNAALGRDSVANDN